MRTSVILLVITCVWVTRVTSQPIIGGFVEINQAIRVEKNSALGDGTLSARSYPRSEVRAQMTLRGTGEREEFFLRADLASDATTATRSMVDLREAYIKMHLTDWLDIKLGRQVATWGTGDFVFANDLFAKDWEAFFTGLDDAYLKPPQDLLRTSVYLSGVTIEIAASPYFTPDNIPDGRRLSIYNPFLGRVVGSSEAPTILPVGKKLNNGEIFGRLAGTHGGAEWTLYGYRGFWPTPQGMTVSGELFYPRLWSAGGSLQVPVGSFLAHAEAAAYVSQDDTDGRNPLIPNSQIRGFAGVEKSLGIDWTAGAQYYAEFMLDHDRYATGLPAGAPTFDELRSTVTGRITKLLHNQTIIVSAFAYWGVSDEDWHLRTSVGYKITDAINWTVGASLIGGNRPYTMFGQFRDNSNVYTRVRYSF